MNPEKPDRNKPWQGRFRERTEGPVEHFTASVPFDKRLYRHDIAGSIAHARMLAHCSLLSAGECANIVSGLEAIREEIARGEFSWSLALEDVHMNVEAQLIERIGEDGKKLHMARSRNDQVVTALRLYLKEEIARIQELLRTLLAALVDLAEREAGSVMPGMTHLQAAQPITFGHHLLAWYEMLLRDHERLGDCLQRVNVSPLGAAALAGTGFPIDREYSAKLMGFAGVMENSLDAVSARDFCIEFASCGAQLMMHLSRCSEELVLWASPQYSFIDLPDRCCTGSSIMPQKKNPDVPELVRGKSGRVYGHLIALLTIMKAQPFAYNRDSQEDKEPLFDTVDTVSDCLRIYALLLPQLKVNRQRMQATAGQNYSTATDLADYLTGKGIPFRTAHRLVGEIVRAALEQGKELHELSLACLRKFSPEIGEDALVRLSPQGSVNLRRHVGGTAPEQVRAAVRRARQRLAQSATAAQTG